MDDCDDHATHPQLEARPYLSIDSPFACLPTLGASNDIAGIEFPAQANHLLM